MTPRLGEPTVIHGTYSDTTTSALRALATNPANPNALDPVNSFAIHGVFDLASLPQVPGQSFGIRASDQARALGNAGDNAYALFVGMGQDDGPNAGQVVVAVRHNDHVADLSTVVASRAIQSFLAGAQQIELVFWRAPDSKQLSAIYALYDANQVMVASGSLGRDMVVYRGEDYLRAGFLSSDIVPVPEPATWLLLAAGLAAVGVRKRSGGR